MLSVAQNPSEFVKDYVRFADISFARYGDRVKHWFDTLFLDNQLMRPSSIRITHNEPISTTNLGYGQGRFPPGLRDTDKALMFNHFILSQLSLQSVVLVIVFS